MTSLSLETRQSSQEKLIGFTKVFEANRDSKAPVVVNVGGAGSSKCFVPGTEVVMADGSLKVIESIQLGDFVLGLDSLPKKVLNIHHGFGNLYKVTQSKAISYVVDEDHLLCLRQSNHYKADGRYPQYNGEAEISVKEYLSKSARFKRSFYGYRLPVEFPKKEVSVDSYFIGLWLGDGSAHETAITTADEEIVLYLQDFATKLGLGVSKRTKKDNAASTYLLTNGNCSGRGRHKNSLLTHLREYNVINNKHIPNDYLINSRENRLVLLAGLLDSDGTLSNNGFTITQKNKNLASQIYFLAASLGFRCSFTERTTTIKKIDFSCLVYTVAIYGDVGKIPTKVKRKQAVKTSKHINPLINGIKSVDFVGKGEYFGFALEGDNKFFLKDFTVVHNSYSIAQLFVHKLLNEDNKVFGVIRKTFPSLRITALDLLVRLLKDYGVYREERHNKTANTYTYKDNVMWFFSIDEADKIKSTSFNYVWVEEANEISWDEFVIIRTRMRAPTTKDCPNQVFLSLNPSDSFGWIATKLCGVINAPSK